VPDPRAERDALIAATALVHGMTVVTRIEAIAQLYRERGDAENIFDELKN